MKKYSNEVEQVELKSAEYRALLRLYFRAKDEYDKFEIKKMDEEEQPATPRLVNKGFLKYLDNTNKVQITLKGWNSIQHPPGLDNDERDKILKPEYNKFAKDNGMKEDWGKRRATHITPPEVNQRGGGASITRTVKSPTGEKKIDVVRRLMPGRNPQQIFEAMISEGVQTTLGSVKCFLKTIKDSEK